MIEWRKSSGDSGAATVRRCAHISSTIALRVAETKVENMKTNYEIKNENVHSYETLQNI